MARRPIRLPGRRPSRPLWRFFQRVLVALILAAIVIAVPPALFIGFKCYDSGAVATRRLSATAPADIPGYARPEAFTYLTLPEWVLVYASDDYARHVERGSPSAFPYMQAIGQYWASYSSVCLATRTPYPFEGGHHALLGVIGTSFTVEYAVKALYENTIGRASAWLAGHDTAEDRFAAKVAADYGTFVHTVRWFDFPFGTHLRNLWTDVPLIGPGLVRKWERRVALTSEYLAKAVYGWAMGLATRRAYSTEPARIHAQVDGATETIFQDPRVTKVRQTGRGAYLIGLPRYEPFTPTTLALLDKRVRFRDIAGNGDILVTTLVPASFDVNRSRLPVVVADVPLLTDPHRKRLAFRVPVARLHEIVPELRAAGATLEHLYDY